MPLPASGDQPAELVQLRGLPAEEWEALVQLHPPVGAARDEGALWNVVTFRPALLAVSVLPDEGEEPLSEQDWAEIIALKTMTSGEINSIYNRAVDLNSRTPDVDLGKD